MHRKLTALALATTAAFGIAALARAGEPQEKKVERRIIVHGPGDHAAALPDPSQISGDHLRVDDLASYAAGESRSYTTESGAEVTITRAEDGSKRYTLDANGKQVEIGGVPDELAFATGDGTGGKRIIVRHHDKRGAEGASETEDAQEIEIEEKRTIGGPRVDLLVDADGPPPLVVEIVGEKDGKTTRQVVVLKVVEKNETN